ncbi:hypothetical protein [Streptomyces litmocidini]|uniref:hypothetical protein n=1 Tax=Streptomyces litmocidini TaxID=67318 RepID=UPI0036FEC664
MGGRPPRRGLQRAAHAAQPGQPHLWWFAFNQVDDLSEKLLQGRYHLLIDYLIGIEVVVPDAIDETSREIYAAAYEQPGAVRASNAWYQTFGRDIEDARTYDQLQMPVLGLGGMNFAFVPAPPDGRGSETHAAGLTPYGPVPQDEKPGRERKYEHDGQRPGGGDSSEALV